MLTHGNTTENQGVAGRGEQAIGYNVEPWKNARTGEKLALTSVDRGYLVRTRAWVARANAVYRVLGVRWNPTSLTRPTMTEAVKARPN
jgi:hypothetical protein